MSAFATGATGGAASSTTSASTLAPSFEPDDLHLLQRLLSTSSASAVSADEVDEIVAGLQGSGDGSGEGGLAGRIWKDFGLDGASAAGTRSTGTGGAAANEKEGGSRRWEELAAAAERAGLQRPTMNTSAPPSTSSSNSTSNAASSLPAAFQTPSGQKHLSAVQSLLRVNQDRAVGLTLAALRVLAERHDGTTAASSSWSTESSNADGNADGGEEKKDEDEDKVKPSTDAQPQRPSLRTLLGTQYLLAATRAHHFEQRLARLRLLAECLRMEQEPDVELDGDGAGGAGDGARRIRSAAVKLLDELDGALTTTDEGGGDGLASDGQKKKKKRGLLQLLLLVSTGGGEGTTWGLPVPHRSQLIGAMDLTSSSDSSGGGSRAGAGASANLTGGGFGTLSSSSVSSSSDFRSYATQEIAVFNAQAARERTEAMEALLVLLYDRIEGGVSRYDCAMLLLALTDRAASRATSTGSRSGGVDIEQERVRWAKLSGLIMAETTALWRATSSSSSSTSATMDDGSGGGALFASWVTEHPLLRGLASSSDPARIQSAMAEITALGKIVRGSADVIISRSAVATGPTPTEAPEAVGLLAYGLLLRLAGNSYLGHNDGDLSYLPRTLVDTGTEYVTAAMDTFAAFDYLFEILSTLIPSPSKAGRNIDAYLSLADDGDDHEFPELPGDQAMLLGDVSTDINQEAIGDEDDAAVVAYASIGREVLAGTVAAFRSVLLSTSSPSDNLEMLCNLASIVYRNSPALCDSFWFDWDAYCAERASLAATDPDHGGVADADPVCHLLDAAFQLATNALSRAWAPANPGTLVNRGAMCAEALPSVAPLLRLLSSLLPFRSSAGTATSPSVQDLFSDFIPQRAIHTTLLGCSALCGDDYGAVPVVSDKVRRGAVEAFLGLSHLFRISAGRSEVCGPVLRASLEMDASNLARTVDGPSLMYNIASRAAAVVSTGAAWSEDAAKISAAALDITTDLIHASSDSMEWITACCLRYSQARSGSGGFSTYASIVKKGINNLQVLSSAMTLLSVMAAKIDFVSFAGPGQNEDVISEVISTVGNGLLIACDVLTSTPLALNESSASEHHDIIHAVLVSLRRALRSIGEIIAVHSSSSVRDTARAVRDGVINFIATSTQTGNAVAFYATLPVSVSLAIELERIAQGQAVFAGAGQEDDDDGENSEKKYGAWSRLAQDIDTSANQKSNKLPSLQRVSAALARNIHALPMAASQGQASSKVQEITKSALAVLLQWGEHVEAIVLERHGYASSYGNGLAIEDAAGVVAPLTGSSMSSDLQTLSPLRLLLSIAPNPFRPSSPISDCAPISTLNLLSRFLGESGGADSFDATTKVVKMALRHSDAAAALSTAGSSRAGDLSVWKALGGGVQLHETLLALLKMTVDATTPTDQLRLKQLSQMLDTCTVSVDAQPALARTLMIGDEVDKETTKKSEVVQAMARLVKKISEGLTSGAISGFSTDDFILCSSSLDTFSALWKTSRIRSNGRKTSGGNDALLHPCDDIFDGIMDQTDIISDVMTILAHHDDLTRGESTPRGIKMASIKLNIVSSALDILGSELFAGLRNDSIGKKHELEIKERITKLNGINNLSLSLASFTGVIESADCLAELLRKNSGPIDSARFSTLHSSPGKLDSRVSIILRRAIATTNKVGGDIAEPLTKYYYAEKLSHSQLLLIKSWTRFAQVCGGASSIESALDKANSILLCLERNSSTAMTTSSSTAIISSTYLIGKMGCHLSSLLAHILGECYALHAAGAHGQDEVLSLLLDLSGRLGKVASTLFEITRPIQLAVPDANAGIGCSGQSNSSFIALAQRRAYKVGCLLRVRLLTSALTLINMVEDRLESSNDSSTSPSSPNRKRFGDACITYAKLASDSLAELQYSPSGEEVNLLQTDGSAPLSSNVGSHFSYGFLVAPFADSSFEIETTSTSGDGSLALELLKVSLSTLVAIVGTCTTTTSQSDSFHFTLRVQRLAAALQDAGTIPSLFRHLHAASSLAGSCYASKLNNPARKTSIYTAEGNALDAVRQIAGFLETASCANGVAFPSLLTKYHVIRTLSENKLLLLAGQRWHSLSQSKRAKLRGYLPLDASDEPMYHEDAAHSIWRATLRTVAGLLQSFRTNDQSSSLGRGLEPGHKECLTAAGHFISTFDVLFIGSLYSCSMRPSSNVHASSSRGGRLPSLQLQDRSSPAVHLITLTSAGLAEAVDVLALVSELYNGAHKKFVEATYPELYKTFVTASADISKALCCFLGSSGTARDIYAALSSLNQAMEERASINGNADETAMHMDAAVDLHPLLSEGVPSARHNAILNAHFASSSCVAMTKEEIKMASMACSKATDSSATSSATPAPGITPSTPSALNENMVQSFQIRVDNEFCIKMEKAAAECVFHSLNVLSKSHPAYESFIYFTQAEAERLDSMALVQLGMIVALRPTSLSTTHSLKEESDDIEYARVVEADYLRQTWDVEEFPAISGRPKRRVASSSLAGMEDLSKRKCVLVYAPAPKLSSDDGTDLALESLSLGHLILALRWSHQQVTADATNAPLHLVTCLAERAASLLGLEVSLHQELDSSDLSSEDTSRKINAQILELFDEDVMRSLDLSSSNNANAAQKKGLESIMDKCIWAAVISQLQGVLVTAHRQREEAIKQWEQSTGGAARWGDHSRANRSPFRGSMLRSLSL